MGLSELLSAALVAFSIEFDDAFEDRMPHRTTRTARVREPGRGRDTRPWLVSLAMWENCMRWLPEEGLTVAELEGLARTRSNLEGMGRWGYVGIESPRADGKAGPRSRLRPTARGEQAQAVWRGLAGEIEARWRERFGAAAVDRLRAALATAVAGIEATAGDDAAPLPDTMPIVGYGLATRERLPIVAVDGGGPAAQEPTFATEAGGPAVGLHVPLARLLTAFALAYEAGSKTSMAIAANVLPVLGPEPTPLRDIPTQAGIAREPVAAAVKFLTGRGLIAVASDRGSTRGKAARLTPRGVAAVEAGDAHGAVIEADWSERLGAGGLAELRSALEALVGDAGPSSPLLSAIEPPEFGWRAPNWPPERLPRFPLVTHRGGFPDGS